MIITSIIGGVAAALAASLIFFILALILIPLWIMTFPLMALARALSIV